MVHDMLAGRFAKARAGVGSVALAAAFLGASGVAHAGSTTLFGVDTTYQLQATYSAAMRLQAPADGIINTPTKQDVLLPDSFKFQESNNFDDGDRNFAKHSLINNRITLLGELEFTKGDYGVMLRGDAFYDHVYRRKNDFTQHFSRQGAGKNGPVGNEPLSINRTEGNTSDVFIGDADAFSNDAAFFAGRRARVLDAYAYGSWYFGDEMALNVRVGRHIAAWGESLFMSGVALAQSPADATKANLPGADVKSILLPVNQISFQFALNYDWTIVGQYKLEYKSVELNPVGEYFSPADVVGPGAQFIWGIKNPLKFDNLDQPLLSDDTAEIVKVLVDLLGANVGAAPGIADGLTRPLGNLLNALNNGLNQVPGLGGLLSNLSISDLVGFIDLRNAPMYVNVARAPDITPSDHGQWGLGVKWQATGSTSFGLYRLRYHNTTPAPIQNFGTAPLGLIGSQGALVTTATLGLSVPTTYNIRYFDGIDLSALTFSTTMFGMNFGGELIYRQGIDMLVDVDYGLMGPIPTPSRGDVVQGLFSVLSTIAASPLWDTLTIVGEGGYVHALDVDEICRIDEGVSFGTNCSTKLKNSKDAWGYAFLMMLDYRNIMSGWDAQIPIFYSGIGSGQSAFAGGLGSLFGPGDRRFSIGYNMTYLQKLTFGVSANYFLGSAEFTDRPFADRDFVGFTVKYLF
ncbi:DUF1302 domain-containing protein [Sinimarinibacterium sp. NLF-5-8]|nr:DUF1302 domain-containing protein [Sinimarinibacterium sp. NLF-5-8]